VAAYRTWLGIEPYPPISADKRPKATEDDLDLNKKVELVALAVREKAVSCRILGKNHVRTLRPEGRWEVVPGEILTVLPHRKWRYAGHPYLTGEIKAWRLDIPALGLMPLRLDEMGMWDPKEHYWGEPDEPIEAWAKPIIKRGPRAQYAMEQVLPGEDPDHLDTGIRHYDIGVKIGELSLGKDFQGLLPWGGINNRPFLRCLHGYGLCLWRLGRVREAEKVFTRMLWLNPSDNQGVRFNLYDVKEGEAWHEDE
jgi:hypothetical protein